MNFRSVPEFDKEFKKLSKDYPTLEGDLDLLKKVITVSPHNLPGSVKIQAGNDVVLDIFKVRHFRCRALHKGCRSGIRVVYGYDKERELILLLQIYYHEREDTNHDTVRIKQYCSSTVYADLVKDIPKSPQSSII